MLQGKTQFGIGHIRFDNSLFEKSAARREASGGQHELTRIEHHLRQGISVNPMPTHTIINGHTIPRVNSPMYMPLFTEADCTAHLSHEEWWAKLDPDVRRKIASCGDGEHLAKIDSESRFHLVQSAKWRVEWGGALEEYDNRVMAAWTEIGASIGLQLAGWWSGFGENMPHINLGFFVCPNGGNGKIVAIMPDGRKVFTEVPPDFCHRDFTIFQAETLPRLLEQHGLARFDVSSSRLKNFFEEIFEELFACIE